MEFFTLNNGVRIPAIGSGTNTFGRDTGDLNAKPTGNFSAFYHAIEHGYTFFDCARSYGNEADLGSAFRQSGAVRKDFFFLSKIPNTPETFADEAAIYACLETTLKDLRTDYLDMYMIHQPISYADQAAGKAMDIERIIFVYKTLEKAYREGVIRSIGVANFTSAQLTMLLEHVDVVPAANQFRSNPAARNVDTVNFCKEHHILPMAHSPMNFTVKAFSYAEQLADEYKETADAIGRPYGKSWGQVLLRYNYQMGICSIPKSHSAENQLRNIDIFDFSLSIEEVQRLFLLEQRS